jgi:hypothetical protein
MELRTFADIKTKMGNDYDITDERFVNDTELCGYANEAIDDAETAIHTLHHEDKYFLVPATFSWVSGTADYVMPTDIYGNKIRKVYYNNGNRKYEITRLKNLLDVPNVVAGEDYRYLIINPSTGIRARFYPTPAETSTNATIWYIRNMKRLTTSLVDATNICEVPECVNFVYQYVRRSIAKKTRRADLVAQESEDLKIQYQLMMDALKEMVPDEDTLIPMDTSFYFEQGDRYY